ncbi:MAG TPA: hemerythrin domain-containing protein [Pyrinomonadaceae bacterium]|nr:hemerythrin domain-containing protein [Pyrinomonadaceae bacterium]
MLATDILRQDHREAENLMMQLEEASGQENGMSYRPIFEQLRTALQKHMMVEEEIFYPAVKVADDLEDQVVEAVDEHAEVKALLTQMNELDPSTPEFQDALATMKAGIEHHVAEEEGEMFPTAEEELGTARMEELGRQIQQQKGASQHGTAAM